MIKYRAFVRDYDGTIREINSDKEFVSEEQRNKVTGENLTFNNGEL
jgi:hypothetical protein